MADELLDTLTRFDVEIVLPDMERVVDERVRSLRDDMNTGFDETLKKLDRLDSEYVALQAATSRLEVNAQSIEQKLDRMALRSEVLELREKVSLLEQRLARLESDLTH
jgi:predicted nuclease with TOPRIM domain